MKTKEQKIKLQRTVKRKLRTRKKLLAQKTHPRLSVFRSNNYISAQIIDDSKGVTLVSGHEKEVKEKKETPVLRAEALGLFFAEKAKAAKIKKVVFDKGAYKYHGRVKAFAEGARKGGLEF